MTAGFAVQLHFDDEVRFVVRGAAAAPSRWDTAEDAQAWLDACAKRSEVTLTGAEVVPYPAPGTEHRVSGFTHSLTVTA